MKTLSFNSGAVSVGDIFASQWGYEQTNVNFYQVIDVKGKKTIIVRQIKSVLEYETQIINGKEVCFFDRGYKMPLLNEFRSDKLIKKQIKESSDGLYIALSFYEDAYKSDPSEKHCFTSYA